MIEPIIYIALGFLAASLLAIMLLPLVHKRAVRLTTRRIEAATPLSIAEIQAEKDHLRAESAMAMRRLEMLVEETRAKAAAQLADVGQKAELIHRLRVETEEKSAAVVRLENSEKSLQDQLQQTRSDLAAKAGLLRDTQKTLAQRETTLAKVTAELDERTGTADYQRIEIVALQTQIEDLKGHVSEVQKAIKHSDERLAREHSQPATVAAELADQRAKAQKLAQKVTALEHQLAEKASNSERVDEAPTAVSVIPGDGALQSELANVRAERDRLQREVLRLGEHTDVGAAAERVDNEMLRERINDVAAEVTRLTLMLEKEGSPIGSILADGSQPIHPRPNGGAERAVEATLGQNGHGTLADRIRALQARMSSPASNA